MPRYATSYVYSTGLFWIQVSVCMCVCGGGGKLKVGFQPLKIIWLQIGFDGVCRCVRVQVRWVNLYLSCLFGTINALQFWVPNHWLNSATREQKGITQTIILTPNQASRLPNSLVPNANLRSANLPVFTSLVWRRWGSNPGLPHPERTL